MTKSVWDARYWWAFKLSLYNIYEALKYTTRFPPIQFSLMQPRGESVLRQLSFALSSLDYEDTTSAISNLQKALHLCQTGQELP